MKFHDDFSFYNNKRRVGHIDTFPRNVACEKVIDKLIHSIYYRSPAGLIYAKILSEILKRSIIVWQAGQVLHVFGKFNDKLGINIEYEQYNKIINDKSEKLGHWSLKDGKNPQNSNSATENDCLFHAIATQAGFDVSELRRKIVCRIRRNERSIRRFVRSNSKPFEVVNSMPGGARYTGSSPGDAKRVLDASQHGHCHPEGRSGHPRGHASYPSAGGMQDSIENYSQSKWRSGFLSREDQDLVCHFSLITNAARDLMDSLNRGQCKVDAHIGRNQLDYHQLPAAAIWDGGSRQGSPNDFRHVVLVGKHFLNQHQDAYADIFVLTFYPVL